jgi:hypothetical protein
VHRRPGSNRLEQQEFGPVEMPDHRHIGGDTCSSFVERSEVMQVEDVGCGGTCPLTRAQEATRCCRVVDGGEDPVGCARAVLVGRVQWGVSAQRVGGRERSGVVDGRDVKPAEELMCITRATGQP